MTGAEWEAAPGLSLAAPMTHRNYGRVLEDVGTAPMIAYFQLPSSELSSVEYFVANPGHATPVSFGTDFGDTPITFENAVHDYNAFELEADKRFANNWSLQASYGSSRTTGNLERVPERQRPVGPRRSSSCSTSRPTIRPLRNARA